MIDDLVERLRAIDKDIILRRFDPEMSFDGMTAHKAAARIEKLEAALRSIADIEHEDLPKPTSAAEGTLWAILDGCVVVAKRALEGKNE